MNVSSFTQLKAALASKDAYINLTKDIPILEDIVIPESKIVKFSNYKFLSRKKKIIFDASFDGHRRQYFVGFEPGDIQGTFSSHVVFPEWWGLIPLKNEIAINCAIKSSIYSIMGRTISLASGYYQVSGPIDLRTSSSYLVGASSGATQVWATDAWTAKFEDTMFWTNFSSIEKESHAAIIWMGSVEPANQSFRTGVRGLSINAWKASKNNPTKRVSGISSTGFVEENSIIEDVCITGFTGFGIGFDNAVGVSTVNGLSIRNFWITGAINKESVGIYIPKHAGVASIRDGTLDLRVGEPSLSFMTWPQYGMVISGAHTTVDNVHIEGCGVGIFVQVSDSPCSVNISNISTIHLMDHGMRYFDEPVPLKPAPSLAEQSVLFPGVADEFYNKFSSSIIIGRPDNLYKSSRAYNATATISNIRNQGRCKYLLRDGLYNVHFSPFGRGQYPNSGCAALAFYARGEGFVPSSGIYPYPDGIEPADPNVRNEFYTGQSGQFFIGPI